MPEITEYRIRRDEETAEGQTSGNSVLNQIRVCKSGSATQATDYLTAQAIKRGVLQL